eukprot:SAG11_NODE_1256_length_5374_cov_5.627627_10_plen_110_part_00
MGAITTRIVYPASPDLLLVQRIVEALARIGTRIHQLGWEIPSVPSVDQRWDKVCQRLSVRVHRPDEDDFLAATRELEPPAPRQQHRSLVQAPRANSPATQAAKRAALLK